MSSSTTTSDLAPAGPRTDVGATLLGGKSLRSFSEQKLSPCEGRFERGRQTLGFFLAPAVAMIFALLPTGMDRPQQLLAAVLLVAIILWVCEPVPIPIGGLIGVAAVVLVGIAPASDVLAPFGSTTIFTFIGAFILAAAMLKHGIAQRLAFAVLSIPGVTRSTHRIIIAFGAITCVLSAFVSNTARVAMLMPTALGILAVTAKLMQDRAVVKADFDPLRLRVSAALMLMLAYWASVGGLLTPVGAPPNLIGRGLIEETTGVEISFVEWTATVAPICAVMFTALALVMFLLNEPEIRRIQGVEEFIREQKAEQSRMSRAEKNTLFAFGMTVNLWLPPAIVSLIAGPDSDLYTLLDHRLDEGIVAAASNNLAITNIVEVTAFSAVLAILISETTSNTALAATFAASFEFMLPVSTPQNVTAYGTGTVPITRMVRTGFTFDILGAILIITIVPIMASITGIGL